MVAAGHCMCGSDHCCLSKQHGFTGGVHVYLGGQETLLGWRIQGEDCNTACAVPPALCGILCVPVLISALEGGKSQRHAEAHCSCCVRA